MSRTSPETETSALADKIDRVLTEYLNSTNSAIKECEARALREILWDNKAGIVAGLRKSGVAPTPDLWRPIETAQKDGTDILLHYDGRAPVVAAWFRNGWAPMDMGGNHLLGEPTHWMPLPQGPDTSTDREGE